MTSQSNIIGKLGEKLALKYLSQKGYHFVQKNYYIRGGEIDLILKKNGILVFVEVKTRTTNKFGYPEESLSHRKKKKLLNTIHHYLYEKPNYINWQCDLIAIQFITHNKAQIKHIPNIFTE